MTLTPRALRGTPRSVLAIFIVASALRVGLAVVNREANDDHMEAIRLIGARGDLPTKADCWECFQPKLFHAAAAQLIDITGVRTAAEEIVTVQLMNATLGSAMLLFVWGFLRSAEVSERARLYGFSLTALNPKLISISGQATNDTLVIFFGAAALYSAYRFLQRLRMRDFLFTTIAAVLGMSSKANGVVTFAAIALTLAIFAVARGSDRQRRPLASYALAFILVVSVLEVVNPLSQVVQNWRLYGTPFTLNLDVLPPAPRLIEKTPIDLPGVRSVVDAFLTFRFVDLVTTPYISSYSSIGYPEHRTSLWSQLYGRAHFVHFDAYPPSWVTHRSSVLNVGRVIFILALLPTGLLLIGIALEAARSAIAVVRGENLPPPSLVLTISVMAFIGFVTAYAYRYRIFVVMKAIFVYPAVLALSYHFAVAFDRLNTMTQDHRRLLLVVEIALGALLVLYVADVASLIVQLAQ